MSEIKTSSEIFEEILEIYRKNPYAVMEDVIKTVLGKMVIVPEDAWNIYVVEMEKKEKKWQRLHEISLRAKAWVENGVRDHLAAEDIIEEFAKAMEE